MRTHSQYDAPLDESGKADENNTGHSFARAGLLFGSLALALGLVLVPVYMKHDRNTLIDSQYSSGQSEALTAVGAHGGGQAEGE